MLPGETIQSGAENPCPECKTYMKPQILSSAAGYYIGTICNCGPYSRESGYYKTFAEADKALQTDFYGR